MSDPVVSMPPGTPPIIPDNTSGVSGTHHKGKGKVSGQTQDTSSSSGGGGGKVSSSKANAAHPDLKEVDDNNMSSAQMYAMSIFWGEKALKERIKGDINQQQYQLTLALQTQTVSDQGDQAPAPAGPQAKSKSSNQNPNAPTDPTEQVVASAAVQTAQTAVGDVILQHLKKMNIPPLIPITAAKAAINAYLYRVITAANFQGVGPAQVFLTIPGSTKAQNLNTNSVNAAEAVGFSEYIQGLVNSGNVETFVKDNIYPNNSQAAKEFAATMNSTLLELANYQTGEGLGLPGYGKQVQLQAKLVRDENSILTDPSQAQQIAQSVAVNNVLPGLDSGTISSKTQKAINAVMSSGPYLTRADLQQKLEDEFQKEFSSDPSLAHSLAVDTENTAATLALGSAQNTYVPPAFDISLVNAQTVQSSIISAMQRDFAASDAAIRLSAKEDQKVKDIVQDTLTKDLNSEQAVRDELKQQLLANFSNLTEEQADDIASSASLGLPTSGPLYAAGSAQTIQPNAFNSSIRNAYQAQVHASPNSQFGQAIDHVSGLTTGYDGTNMIAQINSNYYDSSDDNRSYLDQTPQRQVEYQNQRLYDPGAQLVREWGKVINGGTENPSAKKTIDVSV